MEKTLYKLIPSDFAYLWEECKHCYYQKVKFGIYYGGVFPSMFSRINTLLQNSIMGMNLQDIHPDLPYGIIEVQEGYLKSIPFPFAPDCFISGRFDILSRLPDGTYALIDFKITTPEPEKIQKYATQLHAYKFALENPGDGQKPLKISKMGLVSILPKEMKLTNGRIVFTSTPAFHPVEENTESFQKLIKEISKLLNGPLPEVSETCGLCIYRKKFEPTEKELEVDDIPF